MILELFAKPFPTESKPSKCPTKEKKGKEKQKKRRGENAKGKRQGGCACPNFESCNLSSGTKASSARLLNKVLHSFGSFWQDSDLKMACLTSKGIFWQNFQESMG